MQASRAVCLLAILAVASAIPTMNLPTEEPARVVRKVEDALHADFVAWKTKFARAYEGAVHDAKFAVFNRPTSSSSMRTTSCTRPARRRSTWP